MDLKIFKIEDLTEEVFNNFCKENIIYKYNILENGSIYIFFKSANQLGHTKIEIVETIDRLIKQSENEIMATNIDKDAEVGILKELEAKIATLEDGDKEKGKLLNEVKNRELQVKMYADTILEKTKKIESIKIYSSTL